MIASNSRGLGWYADGKGGNMLMVYDGELTRIFYRFIVSDYKEGLSAFIRECDEKGRRIGFALAGHILQDSDGNTAAAKFDIVDQSGKYIKSCKETKPLDSDCLWTICGVWSESEKYKNDA